MQRKTKDGQRFSLRLLSRIEFWSMERAAGPGLEWELRAGEMWK